MTPDGVNLLFLTEIEMFNINWQNSAKQKDSMGIPTFMEGFPISHEIGDPDIPMGP